MSREARLLVGMLPLRQPAPVLPQHAVPELAGVLQRQTRALMAACRPHSGPCTGKLHRCTLAWEESFCSSKPMAPPPPTPHPLQAARRGAAPR